MRDTKVVKSLSDFINEVGAIRKTWDVPERRELWFRGESKKYPTLLRPELFRPRIDQPLKRTSELLEIENKLYEDFRRCAVQLCNEKSSDGDWDWDSYFLMQHHGAPTRLLDWSDGALMALHFAVRKNNPQDDCHDGVVYVLESYRFDDEVYALPDIDNAKAKWKDYVAKHPADDFSPDEWERSYLPADKDDLAELPVPRVPLLLDFEHITRRIAAQRSRFMVFGTDPSWLADYLERPAACIQAITIDSESRPKIRMQLRDCGVTESVIYPDLDGLGRELRQRWEDRK